MVLVSTTVFSFICNTPHHTATLLQHAATHCNTLQHTATHCNTLLHTCNTLQHLRKIKGNSFGLVSTTDFSFICNALQHTAPNCIILQHTAAPEKNKKQWFWFQQQNSP